MMILDPAAHLSPVGRHLEDHHQCIYLHIYLCMCVCRGSSAHLSPIGRHLGAVHQPHARARVLVRRDLVGQNTHIP